MRPRHKPALNATERTFYYMYPPPAIEIIQRLAHSDLESICYGPCTISLSFENKNNLSFSAPFRFDAKALLPNSPLCDFPLVESRLMRLLGCNITRVNCDTDGT